MSLRLVGLLVCVAAAACLGGPDDPDADVAHDPQLRAERIQNLREAIDQDHAMLQDLISEPRTEEEQQVYEDPQVRAIAARMTEQVRRLERLKAAQDEERVTR